jgi:carbamoyltransferase
MYILSINDGHNSSVALLKDGEIISAIQEERITRVKNKFGFPEKSLNWILDENKITPSDIDKISLISNYIPINMVEDREERIKAYKKGSILSITKEAAKRAGAKKVISLFNKKKRTDRLVQYGFKKERIDFLEHHLAHAASAYFGYGKYDERVLIFTNDGAGDDLSATVSIGFKGNINRISSIHMNYSIGELWGIMTAMMGMVPLEHEYKLMGLAPYAPKSGISKCKKVFSNAYKFINNGLEWRLNSGVPIIPISYNYFREKLEFMRFDWIAGGLQEFTEEFLSEWIKNWIKKTGIRKIVLSGGTFMNVKANKRIMELSEVEDIFVFPSCGDETLVFGGCYYEYYNTAKKFPQKLSYLYLGRKFSSMDVYESFNKYQFKNFKFKIYKVENIENYVANLLIKGNVVAWFMDAEEFGARALGARSILADPTRKGVIKEINEMIKSRDFWMPFAVSILDEDEEKYIKNPKRIPAPYMIMTFDTTDYVSEIEAGVHPYDLTCRPQIVYKDWNPKYYRLIEEFKKICGRGAILNTSFNLHGLPIVSSPEDAFFVLDNSGLKYLAIQDYIVEKIK